MGDRMSDQQDLDETRYEADARRWLRVYPPRWRRAREDEVLGVLLDTRPAGASRLSTGARLDLVRGSVGFWWRTRPPFLVWLLWRWNDTLPGREHREWVLDDLNGRFWAFRQVVLGVPGLVAAGYLLAWSGGGSGTLWWFLLPFLVVMTGMCLPWPTRWRRRTVLREMAEVDRQEHVARRFDGSLPWRARRRWAWTDRLLWPVLAPLLVAVPIIGVAGWWWWSGAPGADEVAVIGPWLWSGGAGLAVVVAIVAAGVVVPYLAMPARARRRLEGRPDQPWRDLRPVPLLLVVPLTAVGAVVPLLAGALPLAHAVAALTGLSVPTWPGQATTSSVVPLLLVWAAAGTALLTHRQVVRARRTGPTPALVDVWSTRGGDDVLVDPPVVPYGHEFVPYPPAPGAAAHPSPGHH